MMLSRTRPTTIAVPRLVTILVLAWVAHWIFAVFLYLTGLGALTLGEMILRSVGRSA
jgi:hypothetical protein